MQDLATDTSLNEMADILITIIMTHDLPITLEEEIISLIHDLYQFGGVLNERFNA